MEQLVPFLWTTFIECSPFFFFLQLCGVLSLLYVLCTVDFVAEDFPADYHSIATLVTIFF